jgi:hypothetical protein
MASARGLRSTISFGASAFRSPLYFLPYCASPKGRHRGYGGMTKLKDEAGGLLTYRESLSFGDFAEPRPAGCAGPRHFHCPVSGIIEDARGTASAIQTRLNSPASVDAAPVARGPIDRELGRRVNRS